MTGSLRVHFNREIKFDVFEFSCHEWNEYVTLKSIPSSPQIKMSPTMLKKGQKGQAQQRVKTSPNPQPTVNDWGVTDRLILLLEVSAPLQTFLAQSLIYDIVDGNIQPHEPPLRFLSEQSKSITKRSSPSACPELPNQSTHDEQHAAGPIQSQHASGTRHTCYGIQWSTTIQFSIRSSSRSTAYCFTGKYEYVTSNAVSHSSAKCRR